MSKELNMARPDGQEPNYPQEVQERFGVNRSHLREQISFYGILQSGKQSEAVQLLPREKYEVRGHGLGQYLRFKRLDVDRRTGNMILPDVQLNPPLAMQLIREAAAGSLRSFGRNLRRSILRRD